MSITKWHNQIMNFLMHQRAEHGLKFTVRRVNRNKRLDKGYWFIGDDSYLQLSLWDGGDDNRKINNIGFTVMEDGSGYIQLSASDSASTSKLLKRIAVKLGGFENDGPDCWFRDYSGKDPVKALKIFIEQDKAVIDKLVSNNTSSGIHHLTEKYDKKYVDRLIADRILNTRIARVCWNTKNWIEPSGPESKSKNKDAYEKLHGFGHEEWLFDTSKLIDGYHYSSIQAIGAHREKYLGETINLGLYTMNSSENKTYWLGRIRKVEVISHKESKRVSGIYKHNGWLNEMHGQLAQVGVTAEGSMFGDEMLFSIRFKVEDIDLLDDLLEVKDKDVISSNYYSSMLITAQEPGHNALLPSTRRAIADDTLGSFKFTPGHNPKKTGRVDKKGHKNSSVQLLHNEIQEKIYEILVGQFGGGKVGTEVPAGSNRSIDLVVEKSKANYMFYELKTSSSIKSNIREAVGQLMEYSYWPDTIKAKKLIILSPQEPTPLVIAYMSNLRDKLNMPIYYQGYDHVNDSLSKLV